MRDAFGGSFMIKLFLVFIFIYMFFTAIALNYAKAFKVKNTIIDYIQDNELYDVRGMYAAEYARMEKYFESEILGNLNYRIDESMMSCDHDYREVYCDHGIRIVQIDPSKEQKNKLGTYYRVETYFTWNLGFLRKLLALSNNSGGNVSYGIWTIAGETRTIVKE